MMWNQIDTLRAVSYGLMWASAILAILAALSTGLRYYIDRRAGELSAVKAMPRRLAPNQREKLTLMAREVASVVPKIEVTAANSNQEAQAYALDFVKSLQFAGCDSDLSLPIPGLMPDVTGIHIAVRDVHAISPGAAELEKLLSALQVQFHVSPMKPDFFPESPFILVVGAKQP